MKKMVEKWGAVSGMSGTVNMEFDAEGNRTKATLINGANGNVYRTLEYIYENGQLITVNTYNPNGIKLYQYSYYYFMDEPEKINSEYGYEDEGLFRGRFAPEYDDAGRLLSLKYNDGSRVKAYTYEYDADGRVVKQTKDFDGDSADYIEYEYGQDGKLSQVHVVSEGKDIFHFYYDAAGNMTAHEGMVYSIGSGDIGAEAYEYYDDGKLKKVKRYGDFTTKDENEVEEIYEYNEDGALAYKWTYNSLYGNGNEAYYNSAGVVIRSVSLSGEDRYQMRITSDSYYDDEGNHTKTIEYREDGSINRQMEWTREGYGGEKYSLYQSFYADGKPCIDGKLEGNVYTETWYEEGTGKIQEYRITEYQEHKSTTTYKHADGEVYDTNEREY